jgi:hypothetical protein
VWLHGPKHYEQRFVSFYLRNKYLYSPELAPCNFYFPKLKCLSKGNHLQSTEDIPMKTAVTDSTLTKRLGDALRFGR